MQTSNPWQRRRGTLLLITALAGCTGPVLAAGVVGAPAPSPATVQGLTQQSAQVQADESASLRQGTITALDASGKRLQVHGIWLEMVDGKTLATRNGAPVATESLKVGETIRFTVAPGTAEAASLRLIYAP
jgi:hypothetical protein